MPVEPEAPLDTSSGATSPSALAWHVPWWRETRGVVMVMLASTICFSMVFMGVVWLLILGPEKVPPDSRAHLHDMMKLLVGMLAGWLIGNQVSVASRPPRP
jgi:hypothetical protein